MCKKTNRLTAKNKPLNTYRRMSNNIRLLLAVAVNNTAAVVRMYIAAAFILAVNIIMGARNCH